MIKVENLVKEYSITRKKKGVIGSLSGIFCPHRQIVRAVDDISFEVSRGEIVGYIGPNGAGKSTTVKILTGILYPTSGVVSVGGISPHKERKKVAGIIGVVFGQRTQLYWDLRLGETFELLKRIYRIDEKLYNENIRLLDEVLQIKELIDIPVRQLSLGQRMRGDLVAAMLHSPSILFLDEPTIGLDIQAKESIRKFILDINKIKGTTIILTTHDLDDVQELCKRLLVINHGKLVEDGPLKTLINKSVPYRYLMMDMTTPQKVYHPLAETVKEEHTHFWLRFKTEDISAAQLISDLTNKYHSIKDINLKEPDIEDVIKEIYRRQNIK